MSRRVTIGWFKQKSGNYALKGISIRNNDIAYDSTSTFREEDARWVTKTLGADANIESVENRDGERVPGNYPEWALRNEGDSDGDQQFDRERAGAALFRYYLTTIAEACSTGTGTGTGIDLNKLESELRSALQATDAGTHYDLNEARAIIGKNVHVQKVVKPARQSANSSSSTNSKPVGSRKE